MNENKLKLIQSFSRVFLRIGGRRFLRMIGIDETKLADIFLKQMSENNEIIHIHGLKIKKSKTTRLSFLTGENEPEVTEILEKELKDGMKILDLGANFGWFTLIAAKKVGMSGNVYAFEPDPTLADALKTNVKLNNLDNVSIIPFAVSNKSSISKFSLNPLYPTRNRLESKTLSENIIDVKTISIDDFCEKNQLIVDFIKMDVEGSEVKALEGMKNTIISNPKLKIVTEFNQKAIVDVGSSPEDLINLLEGYGYTINEVIKNKNGYVKRVSKKKLLSNARVCNLYCYKLQE